MERFSTAMEVPRDARQGRSFKTGAFRFGRIYNVWTGNDLDNTNVFGSLQRIGESIKQLSKEEKQNDVGHAVLPGWRTC